MVGILADDVFTLRMDADDTLRAGKELAQFLLVVHQHTSGRRSEEDLESADFVTMWRVGLAVEGKCLVDIVDCDAVPQTIIYHTFFFEETMLLGERLGRGGGGLDIGHIEHIGHAARCCRPAFACDVSFLCQSRFTEVDVRIDDAGKEPARGFLCARSLLNLSNASISSYDQIAMHQVSLGEDVDVAYNFG